MSMKGWGLFCTIKGWGLFCTIKGWGLFSPFVLVLLYRPVFLELFLPRLCPAGTMMGSFIMLGIYVTQHHQMRHKSQ